MTAKPKVVVIGGGFAGLETVFCLRTRLGDEVDLTLVSNERSFTFRPDTIYVPFGADPKRFVVPLNRILGGLRVELLHERAHAVDPLNRLVTLRERELRYDHLVVASGASILADEVPGLAEHATCLWTVGGMLALRRTYEQLLEDAGRGARRRLLFLVPRHNRCSSPVYEMVFLTDTWLRSRKVRDSVELVLATHEERLVEGYGRPMDALLRERLAQRGVVLHPGAAVTEVEPDRCCFANGERLDFDALVAFPPHVVPRPLEGLPRDARGYVPVDADSLRVAGHERVFAVGDAAAHAEKRACLALLQAGVAAEHLVAEVEARPPMLFYGDVHARLLAAIEEDAAAPRGSRPEHRVPASQGGTFPDVIEVGASPLWRAGARAVGLHLEWRLAPGAPFVSSLA